MHEDATRLGGHLEKLNENALRSFEARHAVRWLTGILAASKYGHEDEL